MMYFVLGRILSLLLDFMTITWRSDHEKDLEILLLRQQLRILQRKQSHPPRLDRWEKLGLAVLAARLVALSSTGRGIVAMTWATTEKGVRAAAPMPSSISVTFILPMFVLLLTDLLGV